MVFPDLMLTTAHKASKPLVHRAESLGNSVVETSSAVVIGLSSGAAAALLRRAGGPRRAGLCVAAVLGRLPAVSDLDEPVHSRRRWAVFRWPPDLAAVARSMTAFDDLGCAELLDTG